MQVSVESRGDLERAVTVTIPAEEVDQEADKRLRDLARRVRMDGFRPGRVPLSVVRRRYGPGVRQEVAEELMRRSLGEALESEGLRPAGTPEFELLAAEPGQDLQFRASFEVFPEIEPAPLDQIVVERPRVEITDADVDAMIDKLRAQRRTWAGVERPSREGDQVTIDFEGTIDGEAFEGGKGEDVTVELGAGRMLEDFERGLHGVSAGEEKTIQVSFPEDYPGKEVAGRTAEFRIRVKSVAEPVLPEVDEELARSFGVEEGGVEAFRAQVRENMQRELDQTLRAMVKEQLIDALLEANPLEVPEVLVKQEAEHLARQARQERPESLGNVQLPTELFEDQARRKVAIGLLFGALLRREGIELDPERLRGTLEEVASGYDNPEQIVELYRQNREAMQQLESHVLEEQLIDHLLEQVRVETPEKGFDEVMHRPGQAG